MDKDYKWTWRRNYESTVSRQIIA